MVTTVAIAELHQLLQAKKCNAKLNFIYTLQGPPFECSVSFNNITYTAMGKLVSFNNITYTAMGKSNFSIFSIISVNIEYSSPT